MKRIALSVIILAWGFSATAQVAPLDQFNQERIQITKNGMTVLAGWSAANLIYSGIAIGQSNGSGKYFHEMNLIWGGINLGLSTLGYLGAKRQNGLSYNQSLKKQLGLEKTFLFNAGLDLAYIAGGLYLRESAQTTSKNPDRLKGYGESVMIQGAGLLLFDGVMYFINNGHGKKLYQLSSKFQVTTTGSGIGMIVKL